MVYTNKGPYIVHLNQYAYLGKGKTIHCAGQIEYAGHEVNDKSTVVGGLQNIKSLCGTVLPLSVRNGLVFLDMKIPTDAEVDKYPHIILTNDDTWDPQVLDYEHDPSNEYANSFPEDDLVIDSRFNATGDLILNMLDQENMENIDPSASQPAINYFPQVDYAEAYTYQHITPYDVKPQKIN